MNEMSNFEKFAFFGLMLMVLFGFIYLLVPQAAYECGAFGLKAKSFKFEWGDETALCFNQSVVKCTKVYNYDKIGIKDNGEWECNMGW